MTINEIVGRLKAGGLDASSTNRSAAVYVADAREGRAEPGWFGFRIICDSEATERRVRSILSRWYDIDASGNVWRLRSRNRVPLMAIKRGGVPPTPPTPTDGPMYLEAVQANSTVYIVSLLATAPNLEYSTDGTTWQEWQHTTTTEDEQTIHMFDTLTLGAVGDRVYFRGDNPDGLGRGIAEYSVFIFTKSINAGGNVMSLLDKSAELTVVPDYGFYSLFAVVALPGAVSILTPPSMDSITSIGSHGCDSMYKDCTSIITAANMSQLTSIGSGGCNSMYKDCTSLITAASMPQLTSIGSDGCRSMYEGDTALTAAADMPSLTTISIYGCVNKYAGCTSLTAAANMPALTTIESSGCLNMYIDCTFNMSDDGTTLNFDFPTPPITAGETTYSTAYDVASWMGNTNGLTNP